MGVPLSSSLLRQPNDSSTRHLLLLDDLMALGDEEGDQEKGGRGGAGRGEDMCVGGAVRLCVCGAEEGEGVLR